MGSLRRCCSVFRSSTCADSFKIISISMLTSPVCVCVCVCVCFSYHSPPHPNANRAPTSWSQSKSLCCGHLSCSCSLGNLLSLGGLSCNVGGRLLRGRPLSNNRLRLLCAAGHTAVRLPREERRSSHRKQVFCLQSLPHRQRACTGMLFLPAATFWHCSLCLPHYLG